MVHDFTLTRLAPRKGSSLVTQTRLQRCAINAQRNMNNSQTQDWCAAIACCSVIR